MDKAAAAAEAMKTIFTCDVCEQAFATPGGLSRHKETGRFHDAVRRNAENKIVFACDVCGKEFATAKSLEVHTKKRKVYAPQLTKSVAAMIGGDDGENQDHPRADETQDPPSIKMGQDRASADEKDLPTNGEKQASSTSDNLAKPAPVNKNKRRIEKRKNQWKDGSGGKRSVVSSNRHKAKTCKVCGKDVRDDHLSRHMKAKHAKPTAMKKNMIWLMKREHAPKLSNSTNEFSGKSPSQPEEVRVMYSTACAMKTVTDALHWAFKHVHDETAPLFEMKGLADASGRVTSVLAPIEEKIATALQQDIFRAANELKREFCNFNIE